jgi:hypothetical protein
MTIVFEVGLPTSSKDAVEAESSSWPEVLVQGMHSCYGEEVTYKLVRWSSHGVCYVCSDRA